MVPCIAYYCEFALEDEGAWPNNKVIFIDSDDLYLLAILNSRVMWWLMSRIMIKMKDDALSVDVHVLSQLGLTIRFRRTLRAYIDRQFFREVYDRERLLMELIRASIAWIRSTRSRCWSPANLTRRSIRHRSTCGSSKTEVWKDHSNPLPETTF